MGCEWNPSHPHSRFGVRPKLTVAGRLEGTFAGRPVEIEATGRDFVFRVQSLRSAWGLRRGVNRSTVPLLRALGEHGVHVRVEVGAHVSVELVPDPPLALRLFFAFVGLPGSRA
jgi:hypothetical protein